jgi:hypothetical protein
LTLLGLEFELELELEGGLGWVSVEGSDAAVEVSPELPSGAALRTWQRRWRVWRRTGLEAELWARRGSGEARRRCFMASPDGGWFSWRRSDDGVWVAGGDSRDGLINCTARRWSDGDFNGSN